jgi:predicted O-linked N-acetylglucosamine transferase (SPINDLY family)
VVTQPLDFANFKALFQAAAATRKQGQWAEAARQYEYLLGMSANSGKVLAAQHQALLHYNHSLCLFAMNQFTEAHEHASHAWALLPSLWQSGLVAAHSLKAMADTVGYVATLERLYHTAPTEPKVAVAYATLVMNHLGDAHRARQIAQGFLNDPTESAQAHTVSLMSRLYDRDEDDTPENISADIQRYAQARLQLIAADIAAVAPFELQVPAKAGTRIGVLSNLLNASPVHSFCFEALSQMKHEGKELVFVQRGRQNDWATEQFKQIATVWVDAVGWDAAKLHVLLQRLNLDELFEMGGWMDSEGMKAVSIKPSRKLYKWVGGQSCTTGLDSFDGFVSDAQQSPPDTAALYSEPLLLMPGSYVRYTPPPYLQSFAGKANQNAQGQGDWGVIANPVKLSRAFLQWLCDLGVRAQPEVLPFNAPRPCAVRRLVLIDKRYANPAVRARVEGVLAPVWGERLSFVVPVDHPAFIGELVKLEGLVDTFPYSCGLTMTEALYVGSRVVFPDVQRRLFCERHGIAHVMNAFAALKEERHER